MPLVLRGSHQSHGRVEVVAVLLTVAALIRAAAAAQAVDRRAARVLPQLTRLRQRRGRRLSVAAWGASGPVSGRRDGFGLNVQALIGWQREGGALT